MGMIQRVAVATGLAVRAEQVSPTPTPAGVMPPSRRATWSGAVVDPLEALTLDAVYRAVSILQTAALQLTVDVWRAGARIATPSLAARPDVDDTLGGFLASTVASLAARGNAYWFKTRGADGTVANLRVLDPVEVTPWRDERGRVRYAWRDRPDWTAADVAHLRLLRVPGVLEGLGPIQAAAGGLRGALDVHAYGASWFQTGETPSGVLSTDQPLTAAQAAEWKAQWAAQQRGHGTAVLGSGLSYAPLALKPAEVQWLESQRWNIQSVARLFGIPSRQLLVAVEGGSTTYANAAQEDLAFVRYTLMGYLREIELALTDALPRGQTARVNVDGLLRADTLTRYQAHAIATGGAPFMTVAEVRDIEGLTGPAPDPASTATDPTTPPAAATEPAPAAPSTSGGAAA